MTSLSSVITLRLPQVHLDSRLLENKLFGLQMMLNKIKRTDSQGNSDHITTLWPHPIVSSILETKCIRTVQSIAKGCVPIEHSCTLPYDTQRKRHLGKNLGREHIFTLFISDTPTIVFIYSLCWSPNLFLKPEFKLLLPGSSSFTIKF